MAPNLQGKDYGRQLHIVCGVILLMILQLAGAITVVTDFSRTLVVIEFSLSRQSFMCRDRAWGWEGQGARSRQCTMSMHCACDRLTTVHRVVHCLSTVHGHCSWALLKKYKNDPRELGHHTTYIPLIIFEGCIMNSKY